MRKLDLKKYDVGWEYLDYDFKSLIGVCIIMPGRTAPLNSNPKIPPE